MHVIKRDGTHEAVDFNKITQRIANKSKDLTDKIVPEELAKKVIEGLYDGVTTSILDGLAAEIAAAKTIEHPDYATLAARIAVSSLHKETEEDFLTVSDMLYNFVNDKTGERAPLLSEDTYEVILKNIGVIKEAIDYNRDFSYDFFGFKTLCRSYLFKKVDGTIIERPQHMLMRVSIGIHMEDIESAIETYHSMSKGLFTHATPTLFNSGTPKPQMSSCFLLKMKEALGTSGSIIVGMPPILSLMASTPLLNKPLAEPPIKEFVSPPAKSETNIPVKN